MSDLLAATPLTNDQKELATTLKASAKTLLSLIEDILDISKIEAGRFSIEETNFDLHSLVNNTIAILKIQAETKGITLTYTISPATPYELIGDPHHLRQVLINLIGNAIKFTEAGGVNVKVTTTSENTSTASIRFEVIDTGIGIPLEAQDSIFESFTQADSSTTRKYGGTGLGTTISKQIVELMGGEIGVHSIPSKGSTFWVEVAFRKQLPSSQPSTKAMFQNIHVLVIATEQLQELCGALSSWEIEHTIEPNSASVISTKIQTGFPETFNIIIVESGCIRDQLSSFPAMILSHSGTKNTSILLIDNTDSVSATSSEHLSFYTNVIESPLNNTHLYNALHSSGISAIDSNSNKYSERKRLSTTGSKILVAEDNRTNQLVIQKILEQGNHYPHIVSNGQEALDALEVDKFDLIIMDMQMPVMGGIEAAKIYNFSTNSNEKTPIKILTATVTTEALKECQESKVCAYLTNPLDVDKVLATIHTFSRKSCDDNVTHIENAFFAPEDNAAPELSILDYQTLESLNRLTDDKNFVPSLISGYLSDSREQLSNMELAVSNKEYHLFRELLHAMKGSSGSIGALKLHRQCKDNKDIHADDIEYIQTLKKVSDTFSDTENHLLEYLNKLDKKQITEQN